MLLYVLILAFPASQFHAQDIFYSLENPGPNSGIVIFIKGVLFAAGTITHTHMPTIPTHKRLPCVCLAPPHTATVMAFLRRRVCRLRVRRSGRWFFLLVASTFLVSGFGSFLNNQVHRPDIGFCFLMLPALTYTVLWPALLLQCFRIDSE